MADNCYLFEVFFLDVPEFFSHFFNFLLKLKPFAYFSLDLFLVLMFNHLLFLVQIFFFELKLFFELGLKLLVVLILYFFHFFLFLQDLEPFSFDFFSKLLLLAGGCFFVNHLSAGDFPHC